MHRLLAIAALLGAAGCVAPPPSAAPPTLPPAIGVRTARDLGGTLTPDGDQYLGNFQRFTVLDGAETGPTATPDPLLPVTLVDSIALNPSLVRPDGPARQPWNGFAGEGIAVTGPDPGEGEWLLEFPGGSCSLGSVDRFFHITSINPAPDGTKAVVRWSEDSPAHQLRVVSLVDGAACPVIVSAHYASDEPTSGNAGDVAVWSPASTSIVFRVTTRDAGPTGEPARDHLVRLDALAGAVPTDVVAPSTDRLTPMGWSTGARLLFSRVRTRTDGAVVSDLVTRAVAGGPERLVDRAIDANPWLSGGYGRFAHYGYFVPGTTTIVYDDGSSTVTNGDGLTFPRFDIRLAADADGATSKSIHGTRLSVIWHQEPTFDSPTPLPPLTDVPNLELVDRFVR